MHGLPMSTLIESWSWERQNSDRGISEIPTLHRLRKPSGSGPTGRSANAPPAIGRFSRSLIIPPPLATHFSYPEQRVVATKPK
jgi:hypothetical protein